MSSNESFESVGAVASVSLVVVVVVSPSSLTRRRITLVSSGVRSRERAGEEGNRIEREEEVEVEEEAMMIEGER